MPTSTVIALAGVLVAPVLAYLAAARRLSGRIATSEASSLWAESASIREDYRAQLASERARTDELEDRVAELVERNRELEQQAAACHARCEALERQLADLLPIEKPKGET